MKCIIVPRSQRCYCSIIFILFPSLSVTISTNRQLNIKCKEECYSYSENDWLWWKCLCKHVTYRHMMCFWIWSLFGRLLFRLRVFLDIFNPPTDHLSVYSSSQWFTNTFSSQNICVVQKPRFIIVCNKIEDKIMQTTITQRRTRRFMWFSSAWNLRPQAKMERGLSLWLKNRDDNEQYNSTEIEKP